MLGGVEWLVGWGLVSEDLKCKRLDEPPVALLGDRLDLGTNSADMTVTGLSGVGCLSLSLGSLTWACTMNLAGATPPQWCGLVGWLGIGECGSEMHEIGLAPVTPQSPRTL